MTEVTKLFQKPGIILKTFPVDETYCNMAKILLAAAYSGKANATMNLAKHNLVEDSSKHLRGNVGAIGVGNDPSDSPAEEPKFDDTKKKAAGSLTSMLFWSQDQVTFLSDDHPRTVVCGQYGCGKTLMVLEKLRRCLREKKLSVKKPRALFISCLKPSYKNSYDESGKYIEPIFDSSIRVALDEMAKTEGCEIHFENAESVCKMMNVHLSWRSFYSKLPEFIIIANKIAKGKGNTVSNVAQIQDKYFKSES